MPFTDNEMSTSKSRQYQIVAETAYTDGLGGNAAQHRIFSDWYREDEESLSRI